MSYILPKELLVEIFEFYCDDAERFYVLSKINKQINKMCRENDIIT